MNRRDEMPLPCIFTSDFYSVSDLLKTRDGKINNRKSKEKPPFTSLGYVQLKNSNLLAIYL